jgi:hypothetical protein
MKIQTRIKTGKLKGYTIRKSKYGFGMIYTQAMELVKHKEKTHCKKSKKL